MHAKLLAPAMLWIALTGAADRGCVEQTEADRAQVGALGTSAIDPDTGECHLFVSRADVPKSWQACDRPDLMKLCLQVITYAVSPQDGQCKKFRNPCDVPDGWAPCDDAHRSQLYSPH